MTSDVALAADEGAPLPIPGHVAVRRAPSSGTVLLVASFGAFLAFLDSTIVNVAFPDIQADFPKASLSTLSWVLNAYNIVLASLMIVAGRVADLVGRRRMFTVGVAIFTIASVLCAAAPSVELLVAYRVVQGVGAALLIPASLALVVQGFDPARRAHGVGLWGAAAAIASGLGPPIGGALVAASSWRLAFLVNLPLGVVAYLIAKRRLVESRSPGAKRMPDLRGAALLGAALGLLTTAVIKGEDWGWADLRTTGAFIASVVAFAGFVVSSRTHRAPLIDPALLKVRSFAVGNALTVVASVGFYAYLLTHVLYLNKVWDYSLLRAGLAVAPAAFVAAVAASALGKVADRRGHRSIVLLGALVWAGSLVWYLTQVGPTPAFVSEWLPGQLLQGVGVGATLPILAGASLARLPKGDGYATASAVNSSARQLGAVLGIAVLVVLIGTPTALTLRDHLQRGWVFAAACFLVVAVGSTVLGRTVHDASDDEPVVRADRVVGDDEDEPRESLLLPAPEPLPDSLADLPLFRGLSPEDLKALDDAAEDVEIDAGTDLFRQGDPGDALYVLRAGRLEVLQGDVVLTELTRGAVLGELALLTGERRSASVRAVRDSRLTRLTADHFARIADLTVMTDLARSLAVRLQEVEPPVESRRTSGDAVIAIVGLEPGSPVEELAATLVEQMARRVTVVDPGRVDRHGLESAEKAAAKVVLRAGVSDAEWRNFCLRVADRVVLVAGAAVPADLPSRAHGADVVLTGRRPTSEELRAWELAVAPRSTHVAPEVTRAATRALAARLTGRSLGLVLGGGGARGFAHVGVLEVLEEAGAQVDRVAGTSMGSVIAAFIASGMDATAVDACSYEYFVRNTPLGDYTLPTRSLIRGRRTDRLLEMAFGDLHIEELPREFRCVSVDLLNRRRVVHRSGNVAQAVAASLRIPGLFPPVVLDDTVHVDGGVLDNLPVSSLDQSEGPLIAINIGFGGGGSGTARSRVRVPGLGDTLMRTMMMASGDAAEHAMATADLVIRPSGGGVGLLEWHQIDRMRESGRAAALAALPEIEALISG